jgi:hypothetical protein
VVVEEPEPGVVEEVEEVAVEPIVQVVILPVPSEPPTPKPAPPPGLTCQILLMSCCVSFNHFQQRSGCRFSFSKKDLWAHRCAVFKPKKKRPPCVKPPDLYHSEHDRNHMSLCDCREAKRDHDLKWHAPPFSPPFSVSMTLNCVIAASQMALNRLSSIYVRIGALYKCESASPITQMLRDRANLSMAFFILMISIWGDAITTMRHVICHSVVGHNERCGEME